MVYPKLFLDPFTKKVCEDISCKITQVFHIDCTPVDVAHQLTSPPDRDLGHFALPCFFLSPKVKTSPNQIATKIATVYLSSDAIFNDVMFKKVVALKGYVNFFFCPAFLAKNLLLPLASDSKWWAVPKKKLSTWLVEYSQPNTHKELHVGHLRNLCFGFSVTTLLKKRGFPVVTCTFPGDTGTHVAKCLWYLKYHNKTNIPKEISLPFVHKGQWLGKIYTKACQLFDAELKDPIKAQKNKKDITIILQQIQKKQGVFYDMWQETRLWSKDLLQHLYQWMGVVFDKWYWESEVDAPSVKWVQELYEQKQLVKSQSAIGLDLGKELGFCLLLKSDGNGLYATKDLYLAQQKMKHYKPAKNIYIVDQRQERHFKQVLAVLDRIGCKKTAQAFSHLKYNFVELPSGPMRSRDGSVVPVMELIADMTNYVKTHFLNKYENKWSEEKIQQTAKLVAEGAIKYGMNAQDLNKKIVFDMKEWLKWDGISGPYIQYAYARACTLLKKCLVWGKKIDCKNFTVSTKEEKDLLTHILWFSLVVEKNAWQMKTSPICYYLFELAKKFSSFYQACPIKDLENEDQKQSRLLLVEVTRLVLKQGLSYLAIPVLEQM